MEFHEASKKARGAKRNIRNSEAISPTQYFKPGSRILLL
jgi:hypothetical protein